MMLFAFTTLAANSTSEKVLGTLLIITLVLAVIIMIATPWIDWFRQELKFINIEIERYKDNPREQARWKRRKKRLWKSLLPGCKYE